MRLIKEVKNLARLMARRSDCGKSRHGAVIIKNKKIIAVGRNYHIYSRRAYTKHAEIDAIEDTAIRGLRGATIILYAEARTGRSKCSRPCPNCWSILRKLGFGRVIYSVPSGWTKEAF